MAKMKIVKGFLVQNTSMDFSFPMSKLSAQPKVFKTVVLSEIDKGQTSLGEIDRELVKIKPTLFQAKNERDILKKAVAYFTKELRHEKW